MEQQEARAILLSNKVVVDMMDRRTAVEIVGAMGLAGAAPELQDLPLSQELASGVDERYIVDL